MVAFPESLAQPVSPFLALSPVGRADLMAAVVRWLGRRNGTLDLARISSNVRDVYFAELEASRGGVNYPIDTALFARNQVPGRLDKQLDVRTLWAVATANVNLCEAWGVNRSIEMSKPPKSEVDTVYATILVEEKYHTRMLGEAVRALGLSMVLHLPPISDRLIVRSILHLPKVFSDAITLMSEIAGVAAFRLLHRRAREIFADEPEALEQIESVYSEILLDEIGHVRFLQTQISAPVLWLCKQFTPVVALAYLSGLPEVIRLCGRRAILDEVGTVMTGVALCPIDGEIHPLNVELDSLLAREVEARQLA